MSAYFRRFLKLLPTILTAVALAVVVWISAITSSDPLKEGTYNFPVKVEAIGQNTSLIMVSSLPETISVNLRAPTSVWDTLDTDQTAVRAFIDLSGLEAGVHNVSLQVQVNVKTVQITSYTPQQMDVTLDNLATRSLPVSLIRRGEPAVGFQASEPVLSHSEVSITGPESIVNQVTQVRATLDISLAQENINRSLTLTPLDNQENALAGVSLYPSEITVTQAITQRYGYRNVVVKVAVNGQIAEGYRLTNISVSPPAVTVYSSDPDVINSLPGYVETMPVDLTGATNDLDVFQVLNLPQGVEVVGDQTTVFVQVSIASIEGSLPISATIDFIGLGPGLSAAISPDTVTALLSGPLPRLSQFVPENIRVYVDLTGKTIGTYQLTPIVELSTEELKVESMTPITVEVVITRAQNPTRTP